MYRLLIVEDDRGIAEEVQSQAERWGLQARCVRDFRDVMAEFAAFGPHIVLLDIALPFFSACLWKRWRIPACFASFWR